jgi:2-keto-4-pentenoate hydratase/2-oxohepta-3-ene-1,7-dioic acid hydratase in catechol pathway
MACARMKLVRYAQGRELAWGLLDGSEINRLDQPDESRLLKATAKGDKLRLDGARCEVDEVTLLAPAPQHARVFCIGLNYRDHVPEPACRSRRLRL